MEHLEERLVFMTMQAIRWSVFVLAVPAVFAQAAPKPEFEVASIKLVDGIGAGNTVNIGIRIDGAQFSCSSYSLKDYLRFAFNAKAYQIEGPDWIAQERYAITAKIPDGVPRDQVRDMVKNLIEDRFKMKLHHTQKEFPVYALVVDKGGVKMKEVESGGTPPPSINVKAQGGPGGVGVDLGNGSAFYFADNKFTGKKLYMVTLADALSIFMDRPVIDMTGLKGAYDFEFHMSEEDYRALLIRSAVNNGVQLPPQALQLMTASPDSLFSAVQLVGLKLDSRKAPLDVIVIDSAEKKPTEN
jgi:uncharacterized protein (TIGR03435 family)